MKLHGGVILLLAAGALSTACSGRYGVGFEPTELGVGGEDTAGSAGSNSSASASSAGTSSGGTSSGGSSATVGAGSGGTEPVSRCGFAPDAAVTPVEALVPTDTVVQRIAQFLEGASTVEVGERPAQPTQAWAAELATQILDEHFEAGSEAPGLAAFLEAWLQVREDLLPLDSAHDWAVKLTAPDATLATLLSEPTGEPHRLGILTAQDVLELRGTITSRGKWMNEKLFCATIPPPPIGVGPLPPASEGLTRRQRLTEHTSSNTCQSCHVIIDPPGYSLEHFDAMGVYGELDAGKTIDSSGSTFNPNFAFTDFDSFAPQLAESCAVAQCFTKAVAGHATSPLFKLTDSELNHVANVFAESDFSIRELVKAIVSSPAFFR
jgi:hypothetical protein